MALVNFKDMLIEARAEKYAIGAFNILDYISMKAAMDAAQDLKSPIIIQTSEKTVRFWGFKTMISWITELDQSNNIPVALHLDHCKDLEFIARCIDAGWTSVMIDASSKPFEENVELSCRVVEMAKPHNVSVEAELGEIGGVEDDIIVNEKDAHLASAEKSRIFLDAVKVDCFAPAIGTAHGLYKGEPKIAFDRLAEISSISEIPLALHGGTGLTKEVFKRCISLGCAKVNISTQLKYALIDSFASYYHKKPEEYNPMNIFKAQYEALKEATSGNIRIFGSNGKT